MKNVNNILFKITYLLLFTMNNFKYQEKDLCVMCINTRFTGFQYEFNTIDNNRHMKKNESNLNASGSLKSNISFEKFDYSFKTKNILNKIKCKDIEPYDEIQNKNFNTEKSMFKNTKNEFSDFSYENSELNNDISNVVNQKFDISQNHSDKSKIKCQKNCTKILNYFICGSEQKRFLSLTASQSEKFVKNMIKRNQLRSKNINRKHINRNKINFLVDSNDEISNYYLYNKILDFFNYLQKSADRKIIIAMEEFTKLKVLFLYRDCVIFKNEQNMNEIYKVTKGTSEEIIFLKQTLYFEHENIIKTTAVEYLNLKKKIYLVKMEYLPNTITYNEIGKNKYDVLEIIYHVLKGLYYLNGKNIIHCDIKPDNILGSKINGVNTYKLIDFNLSIEMNQKKKHKIGERGTISYMAPETAFKGKITPKSDIFSIGATAYYLSVDPKILKKKLKRANRKSCKNCKQKHLFKIEKCVQDCVDVFICKKCMKYEDFKTCKTCDISENCEYCKHCRGCRICKTKKVCFLIEYLDHTLYERNINIENLALKNFIEMCLKKEKDRPSLNSLLKMKSTQKLFEKYWDKKDFPFL